MVGRVDHWQLVPGAFLQPIVDRTSIIKCIVTEHRIFVVPQYSVVRYTCTHTHNIILLYTCTCVLAHITVIH